MVRETCCSKHLPTLAGFVVTSLPQGRRNTEKHHGMHITTCSLQKDWRALLSRGDRIPLEQSWGYGEAVARRYGVKRTRLLVHPSEGGAPMACVQVLQKTFAGQSLRGPVFVSAASSAQKRDVMRSIGARYPWYSEGIVFGCRIYWILRIIVRCCGARGFCGCRGAIKPPISTWATSRRLCCPSADRLGDKICARPCLGMMLSAFLCLTIRT